MVHYTSCPVCGSTNLQDHLSAKDYTVSEKRFNILLCKDCTLAFTQDVPSQEEIGPYYKAETYISHSDTNKGLINKLYHLVRKRTLSGKRLLVEDFTGAKKGRVLDIGCGTGAFLNEMKTAGWDALGLEPDADARAMAKKLFDIEALPSPELFSLVPGSYDAVTMWHVLEHVHQLHDYVEKIHEIIKPAGKFFVAVPNYTAADAKKYKEFWAAYDVPRHLYHFSPKSMQMLMKQHGFKMVELKPMWYDSFYVSMLSEQYKNGGSQNLIGAVISGLSSNVSAFNSTDKCSSVIYVMEKI